MTSRFRFAAVLSVSALALGLTAAPSAFAADAMTTAKTAKTAKHTAKKPHHAHKGKASSTAAPAK